MDHAAHALADELDVPVRVARDGVRDGRCDADQQRRQRDERPHERGRRFGRARLAHERDEHLRRSEARHVRWLGAEASTSQPGHGFSR